MPKNLKKETLADLKSEIGDKSSAVADEILKVEKKVGEAIEEAVQEVESLTSDVKKDKRFGKLFKSKYFKHIGFAVLLLIAIGGVGSSAYFYNQYTKAQVLGAQNEYSEVKSIVESVGKLMDLPSDEPTVATVSDVEKLRTQAFFNRAENGDKLLIYQTTKKAILYRPSTNKIIDVATVNLGEPSPPSAAASSTSPEPEVKEGPYRVVVWNGTTTTGLTKKAEENLSSEPNLEVVERDNATKRDYEDNIVINLTGVEDSNVEKIAGVFNAKVVELPSGESAPKEGDILVILGRSFISATE